MSKKKLNKKVWYSSEVDVSGKPILPPLADNPEDLEGLHEGELFLHNSDDYPSVWVRTKSGLIKPLIGGQSNTPSYWEVRELPNGDTYLYTSLPIVTQSGVTMYADGGSLNFPTIYDGLPIDNNTIYWENGILKAKGGGGVAASVSWADITEKPEWLLDDKISYSEIEGTPDLSVYALKRSLSEYVTKTELSNLDYADKDWVKEYVVDINTGNITAITKQMVIDALGFTPISSSDIPTALPNPHSLKFGSKLYDGSASKTILASDLGALTAHQTIYALTVKDSAGTTQLTYTPNSGTGSLTLTKAMVGLGNVDNLAASGYLTALSSNTTNAVSITVGGTTKSITSATMKTSLGLGSFAYKSSLTASDIPNLDWSKITSGKPTTLSGYGITDAKIANGVITLGSSSITPLTGITTELVTGALGYTPYNAANFTKANIKSTLGISDWALAASKPSYTWDNILGRPTLLSSFTDDVVAGKYLPLSGGTITGEIKFNISNLTSNDISPNIIAAFKAPRVQANDLFVDTITLGTTSGTSSSIPLKIRKYSKITSLNPDGITDLVIVDPNGSVNIGTTTHPCELNVEGNSKANSFIATSSNGLRLAYGNYGTLLRNDGSGFFILLTNSGGALDGSYNTLRPFKIDLATGDIQMESNVTITKSFKLSKRLRVDARESATSFGYLKSNIANATNIGIAHLGTNYGGTSDTTKEDYDMTAISMYRGIVGIGKEYDYTSLRAIYDAGVDLGMTKGLLIGSAKVLYVNNELNISTSAYINGNILTTGGITMYSQRNLKNITDERGLSLDELSAIKPTRYTWKDGRDNRIHFGGIADDIQQVLPEVVYNVNGVLTMDYGNAGFAIASSLIKPVVDHEQRIKALEKENEELKQEIKRLRA